MLHNVKIENYQAIHSLDIDLSPYTVVVGPSSSGKSAFTRALKTLYSNKRGTAFITQGEKTCKIQGSYDSHKVTLTRSTSTEPNSYLLTSQDSKQTFTKLGGNVPEEITEAFGVEPNSPLHFASQFDAPYLLSDSPLEAARQLAGLTDAHTIMEAARKANTDRLAVTRTLKTRQTDLDAAQERLEGLPDTVELEKQLEKALAALDNSEQLKSKRNQLVELSTEIQKLVTRVAELRSTTQKTIPSTTKIHELIAQREVLSNARTLAAKISELRNSRSTVISVPNIKTKITRLAQLEALRTQLVTLLTKKKELAGAKTSSAKEVTQAEHNYLDYLAEIGTCPTCKQTTTHLH